MDERQETVQVLWPSCCSLVSGARAPRIYDVCYETRDVPMLSIVKQLILSFPSPSGVAPSYPLI